MRTIQAFVCAVALMSTSGCVRSGPDPQAEACGERGVSYFKEMGSYPPLKSAPNARRRAEKVARER